MAVVVTPKALQECYQDIYYNIILLLWVSRNIGKVWKTLLETYQGLSLPHFEVHALSEKIHFIWHKWDSNNSTNKMAAATYKTCMVEVGMYRNIVSGLLEEFNILVTKHIWYYNLWELCHRLVVKLEVDDKFHNKPVRQGNRSIIDVIIEKSTEIRLWKVSILCLSTLLSCTSKIEYIVMKENSLKIAVKRPDRQIQR